MDVPTLVVPAAGCLVVAKRANYDVAEVLSGATPSGRGPYGVRRAVSHSCCSQYSVGCGSPSS